MTAVSVIIPVRDDAEGVARTVADLHRQSLPTADFEVLVVDNASRDGTAAVARRAAGAGPADVRVLSETGALTSYGARNAGILAARGDLLCFIDAGMGVPAGYLQVVSAAVRARALDYAGCPVAIEVTRPTVAACFNRLFGFPVAAYLERRAWVPTCCLTVRREVVARVGAFAASLPSGGDVEFGRRVAAAGLRQGLIADVTLSHPARDAVADLVRKTRRTARGKARLARMRPEEAATIRGYRSWRRLRPVSPRWVREELAASGLPVGWRTALGVAVLKSWLDVVRVAAAAEALVRTR